MRVFTASPSLRTHPLVFNRLFSSDADDRKSSKRSKTREAPVKTLTNPWSSQIEGPFLVRMIGFPKFSLRRDVVRTLERVTGGPVHNVFPSIHEHTFQNYRSEWMMPFETSEAGKQFLDATEKYNASIVRSPTCTNLPVFARPTLTATYKRMFKGTKFSPDGYFLLLLNANPAPAAVESLRRRMQQFPFKVVRGSLEELSRPVVLEMESMTDAMMLSVILDGHKFEDKSESPKQEGGGMERATLRAIVMRV